MSQSRRVAYISDQVFYSDGAAWYTSNGFPLPELFHASGGRMQQWTFFGRLQSVEHPPKGALRIVAPPGLMLSFVGPTLKRRGMLGYLGSLPQYLALLRDCIRHHDVVWVKANFVAAWLAVPFLLVSSALRISHQVGDPAWIAVGPPLLLPAIRLVASSMTRLVHRVSDVNVFVSKQLAECYGSKSPQPWIYNESRLRPGQIVDAASLRQGRHTPTRLLYVGRLSPEKGIPTLLRAFAALKSPSHLRLAGGGSQLAELEALAVESGVRERVHFLGNVDWGNPLFELMRDSDILVLPSFTEGLPLVLLEAMAQGLPVIATRVGGIPELVRDEITGLLFPAGDADALSACLSRLIDDTSLRSSIRLNAIEVARANTLDEQLCSMFSRIFSSQIL